MILIRVKFSYRRDKKIFLSKGDVEFDVKNWNSSIGFLFMKSKFANFACVLLDQ